MFKLNAKFDDLLFYSLSHFIYNGHTVHVLTQQCLLPLWTSIVKSSLFTHVHSSPLSLAARIHRCHANHSHYINNGWTFSGQMCVCMYIHTHIYSCILVCQRYRDSTLALFEVTQKTNIRPSFHLAVNSPRVTTNTFRVS